MAALGQPPSLPPQGPHAQPITQLEFRQAMSDFKTMFPEMDEDVIEVVLRANSGAVDATIDQLLAMSTDNENEKLRAELDATENAEVPPRYSPATPPPSYHQAVPYAQSPSHSLGHTSSPASPLPRRPQTPQQRLPSTLAQSDAAKPGVPLRILKKWEPPLLGPLPRSFLRVGDLKGRHRTLQRRVENVTILSSAMLQQRMEENERQRQVSGRDDPEHAQYLEDERIAIFLQNEEFVQELRRNKEFMSTLERDVEPNSETRSERNDGDEDDEQPATLDAFPYTKSLPPPTEDADAAFREKLKNMGKVSRRKFAQLARLFSRRKRRNFRQMFSLGEGGSNPSRDNLLLHEDEYSELSEEDSDVNKDDTWNSHSGSHTMERTTPEHARHEIV